MSAFAGRGTAMARKAAGWSSESFRAMALERLRNCPHVGRLCEELVISSATLRRWRSRASGYLPEPAVAQRPGESLQRENERLKRSLGEKTLAVDFLQGALQQIEARSQQNAGRGGGGSISRKMRRKLLMQGRLGVNGMCRVGGGSRASFYRWLEPSPPVEQEV